MQKVCRRHAASQCSIDRDVLWNEHIFNLRHGGDRKRALIDRVKHRVRVAIDDAGRNILARRIDHTCTCRCIEAFADLCDLAVLDEDVGVLESAANRRHHRSVLDKHDIFRLGENSRGQIPTDQEE